MPDTDVLGRISKELFVYDSGNTFLIPWIQKFSRENGVYEFGFHNSSNNLESLIRSFGDDYQAAGNEFGRMFHERKKVYSH